MADGEIKNQDYYNKAQKAIKGSEAYAKEIIGKINPDEVDSISGLPIPITSLQTRFTTLLTRQLNNIKIKAVGIC